MQLKTEVDSLKYKGILYPINYSYWYDEDNDEEFTTEEQETNHMNQLYTQAGELDKVE